MTDRYRRIVVPSKWSPQLKPLAYIMHICGMQDGDGPRAYACMHASCISTSRPRRGDGVFHSQNCSDDRVGYVVGAVENTVSNWVSIWRVGREDSGTRVFLAMSMDVEEPTVCSLYST